MKRVRVLTFALAGGVLAYGIVLAALSRPGFPSAMRSGSSFPYLCDKPVGEDAYYMLTVARNVARGRGFVYNNGIRTTGVQPLATLVYAGLIWGVEKAGGDEWMIVRAVLAFGFLMLVLFAHAVGLISGHLAGGESPSDRAEAYGLGFCFALLDFSLLRLFTYGLETPIYLLLVAAAVLTTMRIGGAGRRGGALRHGGLVLGGLFGAAALARIDFLVLAAVFLAVAVARRSMSFRQAALAGGVSLVIVGPWLVWVRLTGGSWMPSSGLAQFGIPSAGAAPGRLAAMAAALADHATPWAYEANRLPLIVLGVASGLAVWAWLLRGKRGKRTPAGGPVPGAGPGAVIENQPFFAEWVASLAVLVMVYTILFHSTHFYLRYTAPVLVILLPVLAALVQRRLGPARKARARAWLKPAIVSGLGLLFAAEAMLSLHAGTVGNDLAISAGFVRRELPATARVGAFQSGVLGFFNEGVFNLDGKIDMSALAHLRSGNLPRYLDRQRIDVIVDWPTYIYGEIERGYLESRWTLRQAGPTAAGGRSICLLRMGSDQDD